MTLRDRGDLDGQAVWLRIMAAVETVLATAPPAGQRVQ